MLGITRIAPYFPRHRLDRALMAAAWGTRAAGTRTVAGPDEDALTLAVDAVLACLGETDPASYDALAFASTSAPERPRCERRSTPCGRAARARPWSPPPTPAPRSRAASSSRSSATGRPRRPWAARG